MLQSRRTGKWWAISLLKKLWQIAWDLWEHRNGILHNRQNMITAEECTRLDQMIRNVYYDYRQSLLIQDRYLTSLPLRTLLSKGTSYKRTWLSQMDVAIKNQWRQQWSSRQRQEEELQAMQRSLRRWLQTMRWSMTVNAEHV
jgi:hypothetical protein